MTAMPVFSCAAWDDPAPRASITVSPALPIVLPAEGVGELEGLPDLYRKATRAQWDAEKDLDWSHELDERNPLQMSDGTIPIAGSAAWAKLDPPKRSRLRRHLQAYHISQILHGERASMLCASKLTLSVCDPAVKACASLQAADEARHIEVYARLLRKIGESYPVSASLSRLLRNVLEDTDPAMTMLGMQILIEGLALAFFKSLQMYSNDSLVKHLLNLIVRDEARHFACGKLALIQFHRADSEAGLRRREEFVVDAIMLLHDYLFADEIWEPLGLPRRECAELSRQSEVIASMHRTLFRHLVPAVRGIGLLGPRAQRAFAEIGVLDYAIFPE